MMTRVLSINVTESEESTEFVMINIMLNKELVIVRLGSEAHLLVTEVTL